MDPVSAAASMVAFVSIAIQLADSTKKLCEFWDSFKEAPSSIQALIDDLNLVSVVLREFGTDATVGIPDETCLKALRRCEAIVADLNALMEDLVPGFASSRLHRRLYSALRAVGRKEKILFFRTSLTEMKSTLTLIQQRLLGRLVYVGPSMDANVTTHRELTLAGGNIIYRARSAILRCSKGSKP